MEDSNKNIPLFRADSTRQRGGRELRNQGNNYVRDASHRESINPRSRGSRDNELPNGQTTGDFSCYLSRPEGDDKTAQIKLAFALHVGQASHRRVTTPLRHRHVH